MMWEYLKGACGISFGHGLERACKIFLNLPANTSEIGFSLRFSIILVSGLPRSIPIITDQNPAIDLT